MLGRVMFLSKTMATCLVAVLLWLSNGVEKNFLALLEPVRYTVLCKWCVSCTWMMEILSCAGNNWTVLAQQQMTDLRLGGTDRCFVLC